MTKPGSRSNAGVAILIAVAAAITTYLPAAYVYRAITSWQRAPMRHGEDVMARGLEVLFIGGPLGALSLALLAGWITYRSASRFTVPVMLAVIAACALLSVAVLYTPYLR